MDLTDILSVRSIFVGGNPTVRLKVSFERFR